MCDTDMKFLKPSQVKTAVIHGVDIAQKPSTF